MESDNEERSRDEEMNKLRSSSASPSALSTASSGSPLVRSSSNSSNKRPAPTSIAAAQLQRQQLELNSRLLNEAKRAGSKQGRAIRNQQAPLKGIGGFQVAVEAGRQHSVVAVAKGGQQKKANESCNSHEGKSVGYNVGKSIAFQANR